MMRHKTILFFLLPILISFLLHARIFNLDVMGVHSWRQSQTQTVIYNFNYSDNSILNPQRFDLSSGTTTLLYEFPLYQWLIAQVNTIVGYSVANTRIMTYIFFVFGLIGFYRLIIKFVSPEIALLTNICFCFSPLMYYYSVNPLPDTLALAFGIWALNFLFEFVARPNNLSFILFSTSLSLAALIKLPYILFGSALIIYFKGLTKRKDYKEFIERICILTVCLIPVVIWYYRAIQTWSNNPIAQGILNNDKSLSKLIYYLQGNLISTLPELITNYAACPFLILGIFMLFKKKKSWSLAHHYLITTFLFFTAYFLYELNMIKDTHDYYLMPFVPLIFLLVARGIILFYEKGYKKPALFLILLIPVMAWVRMNNAWDPSSPGFNKEYLTKNETFKKIIPENALCIIDHDDSKFIALYFLKRNGYSLGQNEMSAEAIKKFYLKGARYLITDNLNLNLSDYQGLIFKELHVSDLKLYQLSLP